MKAEPNAIGDSDMMAGALEEAGSFGLGGSEGELVRSKKLVPMQIFLPRKEAVLMDEIRIRRMRKGQDLSRSRLVFEALRLLAEAESTPKNTRPGA